MNDFSVPERTVVVTGATSGLGRAAAGELACLPGWTVVVAARDLRRGALTVEELRRETPRARAVALELDLASLYSVRAFAAALAERSALGSTVPNGKRPAAVERLPPLGAIVANAGVQHTDRRHTTADGFEAAFGTNHLGHFLLLRLLLDQLAERGRVVIVSSGTHKHQRLRNLGFPPPRWAGARTLATPGAGSGQVAYATSKLANAMTALELSRRVDALRPGARIAVHALDPGLMPATGLAQHYPPLARRAYAALAPLLTAVVPGVTTAAASGAQLARMVADPAYAAPPNGRYVELTRDGEPSAQARDRAAAAALWEESERLVGLPPTPIA
jgi:protochlorophyllide reductase